MFRRTYAITRTASDGDLVQVCRDLLAVIHLIIEAYILLIRTATDPGYDSRMRGMSIAGHDLDGQVH
jgi:hypothetical protein